MRRIKIFLASSIVEFEHERHALKNFCRQLENALIDCDIYLRMFVCEYADNAVAAGRKQDEFSHEIDDSDIFLILVGKRLGDFTLEEYDYVLETQRRRGDGLPKILAAFSACGDVEQSAGDFAKNLSVDAVPIEFDDVGKIKAALALSICELLNGAVSYKIENERIIVAEKVIKL